MRMAFFVMFILLLFAGLGFAMWHVWHILPLYKWARWLIVVLLAACPLSMFLMFGGAYERWPLPAASVAYHINTSSVIILLYLLLTFLALDLCRLLRIVPKSFLFDSWTGTIGVALLMVVVFVAGNIKYHSKVRVPLLLTTKKALPHDYRMVMVSDLHLGYHNRRADLDRWVAMLNKEGGDMLLVAGDLIDRSIRPLAREEMAEGLRQLQMPVYACLGNHEYYANHYAPGEVDRFYREAGITLLRDSVATVGDIALLGRDDRINRHRRPLGKFSTQNSQFFVVLDHQPSQLEEAEQAGIDLQISGHTHRGQMWPLSWITDRIYECSWGTLTKGNTTYCVTSGLGIWGAKYRLGSQSEYLVINLVP